MSSNPLKQDKTMQKNIFRIAMLMLSAGAMTLASCSSDDGLEGNNDTNGQISKVTTLTASTPGSEATTRSAIDGSDNTMVNWQSNDALSVFDGTNNDQYTLTDGSGTTTGSFSGTSTGTPATALYPYNSEATYDGSVITATIPSEQTATEGSYDPATGLMIGAISGTTITFKHVCAYLRVVAPDTEVGADGAADGTGYTLTKITINTENMGTALTGKATFSPTDGSFTAVETSAAVTLKGTFTAGSEYYAAILPISSATSLIISYVYVSTTDHKCVVKTKASSNTLTLQTGHTKKLPAVTSDLTARQGIQLWADGPYFATTNLGETTVTGDTATYTWTASGTDSDSASKTWGSAWKVPTKTEMNELYLASSNGNSSDKVSCTYTTYPNSSYYGFNYTGSTTGYTNNSLFLPAKNGNSDDGYAFYWSGTDDGDGYCRSLYLRCDYGSWEDSGWGISMTSFSIHVRPVLK